MKRISTFAVAGLFACIGAAAQVSVDAGIATRLEANVSFPTEGEGTDFHWGNSSLYTTVDAAFGEKLSFSWVGHFLSSDALTDKGFRFPFSATPALYSIYDPEYPEDGYTSQGATVWRSQYYSFTDVLYLTYSPGSWSFGLGKNYSALASYEYDPNDWEWNYSLTSLFWQYHTACQWGGSVAWTTPSEKSTLTFEACSSPFADWLARPWQDGCGMYTLNLTGEYGPILLMASASAARTTYYADEGYDRSTIGIGCLSVVGNICDRLSVNGEAGLRWDVLGQSSFKGIAGIDYAPCDAFSVKVRGGYDRIGTSFEVNEWAIWENEETGNPMGGGRWFAGATFNWKPVKACEDFLLHATFGTNSDEKFTASVGLLYNLNFKIGS